MALSNYKKCGKMLINSYSLFCGPCIDQQKDDIEKVKVYVRNHANPTLLEAHRSTAVPLKTLQDLIKDGVISRM